MILVIDCCIRGENSSTKKLYESYLNTLENKDDVEILNLCEQPIAPLDVRTLELRDKLIDQKNFGHIIFGYAMQFRRADEIVIAAPYWDLSFPSLLKVYLEQISVSGVTFGYEKNECVGYCKAKRMLYFTTCGGYFNQKNLASEYIKALAEMFGISNFYAYAVEGMDIDPSKRDEILKKGIGRIMSEIKNN